jgi:5'-deoxynucleotidase YfbR-like HD superfamily hydrolase
VSALIDQLRFIRRGVAVRRYHTHRTLVEDTVGHHSANVALLCMVLDPRPSAELLKAALSHDLAEHRLGDMPTPAKQSMGETARELLFAEENRLLEEVGLGADLHPSEATTLKLADIADGMLFCLEERSRGNISMDEVFTNYGNLLEDFDLGARAREVFVYIKQSWLDIGGSL